MPTLILGKGIEPLQFGMSTEKVQEVFGAPEDTYEKTDTPSWYYYEPHSIALYFDENKKLRSIAVKHDSSIVRGIDFYGQTEEELQQSIESLDFEGFQKQKLANAIESAHDMDELNLF